MGKVVLANNREAHEFVKRIESASGTRTSLCYQCGKCAAGCPVAFAMDYTPRQIIRLLQLGLTNEALHADSIWICATCDTCSTRCPRGVDIASMMDAMRREAFNQGIKTDPAVAQFNRAFLNSVGRFGRLHETSMVVEYNLRIGKPLKDADQGPLMMSRGKLKLFPEIKGRAAVKQIMEKTRQMGGDPE